MLTILSFLISLPEKIFKFFSCNSYQCRLENYLKDKNVTDNVQLEHYIKQFNFKQGVRL
jgi:hypothetical protein